MKQKQFYQWFKDFVHNTLVHPLKPFIPSTWWCYLHDKTAAWAYPNRSVDYIPPGFYAPQTPETELKKAAILTGREGNK